MSFDEDARKKARVNWLLGIAAFVAYGAYCQFFYGWLIGFVMVIPVIGVAIAVFLVNHGFGGVVRLFKHLVFNELQGIHHAFHDRPVCVRWQDGNCQTAATDVFTILQHQTDATALRRLALQYGNDGFFRDGGGHWWFGESALLDWLQRRAQSQDPQTLRLLRWFEKEVFPPLRKKAELAGDAAPEDLD